MTRAGQPGSALHDTEGALWVVQMDSQISAQPDGERLGSNRLLENAETKDTMSNLNSIVIYWIDFDEFYQQGVLDYNHPGGIQAIGNILAVALEGRNRDVLPEGKIAFFDTSFPEQPMYLGIGKDIYLDHKAAAVGIAWHPTYQRYFVVVGSGGSKNTLEFYKSTGSNFNAPNFQFEHFDTISTEELQALADNGDYQFGPEPQSLNLVVGQNKRMYLIGAANTKDTAPIIDGSNRMWLWEVIFPESLFDQDVKLKPLGRADKSLHSDGDKNLNCFGLYDNLERHEANFSAGAGVYVSPTGELLYYATSYWNLGPGRITRMAELRSRYVSHTKTCGPQFLDNHLGGPYLIPEGSNLRLKGNVHVIYPWVHMYEDANFEASNNVMIDWSGQFHDDYSNFKKLDGGNDGFKDKMSSFRFCGPVGSTLEIFDHPAPNWDWESAKEGNDGWLQCKGTGQVIEVSDLSKLSEQAPTCIHIEPDEDDFSDDADSARLLYDKYAEYQWRLEGGGGGHLEEISHDAIFHAHGGNSNNTVWLNVMGKEVKTIVDVYNVPPEITAIEFDPAEVDEGQEVTLTATWIDPGAPQVTARVYWGDGTDDEKPAECSDCPGPYSGPVSFSHVYADNGDYTVKVCVDDDLDDNIDEACVSPVVTVNNVAPTVDAGLDMTIDEAGTFTLALATFNDKGTLDTHTATINWDDGFTRETSTEEDGVVSESLFGPPGSTDGADGTVAGSFVYGDNSIYNVEVCVADDDGATTCDQVDVTVNNVDPTLFFDKSAAISFAGGSAFLARRGVDQTFNSTTADIGSDDLTYAWTFPPSALGSLTTYFNDDTNPDPPHSPHGVFPFETSDSNKTTFTVPGVYAATIDIYDDDTGHVSDSLPLLMTDSRECTAVRPTWDHQFGAGGKQTIDDRRLQGYLDVIRFASAYFDDSSLANLQDAQAIFSANGSSDANHLKQHALAAWLNFASGGVLWDQQIRHLEGPFYEVVDDIDTILLNPNVSKMDIIDAQQKAIRINTSSSSNSSCNDAGTP